MIQMVLTAKRKGRKFQPQEIVLLGVENSKRIEWSLAVVEELIPGRDGKLRLVRLTTASGVLLRPIQSVYRLKIHEGEPWRPDQMPAVMAQETKETVASLEKREWIKENASPDQKW